jgi:broad specificity phosphatase PhoE
MTIVYLVRHAETTFPPYEDDPPNPHLGEPGRARAQALADLLGAEGIDHVFSTDYRRTQQTAAPLAERLGLPVESYDPRSLDALAARLRAMGGRHVVVGHSNTTPAAVGALGGDAGEPIDEQREFDRLYVVVIDSAGAVTTLHLRYGNR